MWELIKYMIDTFTFLLSGVNMVVNLWSSDISNSDVVGLLCMYCQFGPPRHCDGLRLPSAKVYESELRLSNACLT